MVDNVSKEQKRWKPLRLNSLGFQVFVMPSLICIAVLIMLFWINSYSIHLIQQHICENSMDTLNLNMRQLDAELAKMSEYLVKEFENRKDIDEFASENEVERYNASISYTQSMNRDIHMFNYVEGIMYYSAKNQNQTYHFTPYSTDFSGRMQVMDYIIEHREAFYVRNQEWQTYRIEDQYVLIYAIGNENTFFCAWTTFDTFLLPTEEWKSTQDSQICIVSENGELLSEVTAEFTGLDYSGDLENYYFAGPGDKYLVVGVESGSGDFRMMNIMNRNEMLGQFYIIRILGFLVLGGFFFGLLPFLVRFLNQYIYSPINKMETGIKLVEQGDFSVRIEHQKSSDEISHLVGSFNEMVSQIRDLKIQAYEDALERRELEMDYLQLQIEPHFYLNALNLINTMAQVGDTALIRRLTENLSSYLRYIVSSRNEQVTLREEVEHNRRYIQIMELRFGDSFQYLEEIDESHLGARILPLLIQMLVENSIKYAFDIYGETRIELVIKSEGEGVLIRVADNGKGYPQEILRAFWEGHKPEGKQIGLWNIKMRLEHQYPGKARMTLYNKEPQGAVTEIWIKGEER